MQNLRPARDTCEQCHWPAKFHGDKVQRIVEYGDDEKNTESVTTLQLHVGGGTARPGAASGIHWHADVANEIDYIATDDKRQVIPVRAREGSQRRRARVCRRRRDAGSTGDRASGGGWTAWTATTARAIRWRPRRSARSTRRWRARDIPTTPAVRPPRGGEGR